MLIQLHSRWQGDIIPRTITMNITDPGGEPAIALIETEKRRNAVSLDDQADDEAARVFANVSIMSSSTPALRCSGRAEQSYGGQNGPPRLMTLKKLAASKVRIVAEEEEMEQPALVPTILLLPSYVSRLMRSDCNRLTATISLSMR